VSKIVSRPYSSCLAMADKSKANHNIHTRTGTGEISSYDASRPSTSSCENNIASAAVVGDDPWDGFDFGQLLDHQFLDPSWLNDMQAQ